MYGWRTAGGGGGPAAAGEGSVPVRRGVPLGTVGARPGRGAAPLLHVLEATAHAQRLRAVPDRAVQVLAIIGSSLVEVGPRSSCTAAKTPSSASALPAPPPKPSTEPGWSSSPASATTCQHHCGQSSSPTSSARTPTGHTLPELNSASQPSQNWLHACATVSGPPRCAHTDDRPRLKATPVSREARRLP
jgi:hypothetical protein